MREILRVLALLEAQHSRWGTVRATKAGIEVDQVQRGTETELRHFLESVVLQVNSELPQPEQGAPDAEQEQADRAAQADRQMTAAFRAFADD